MEQGPELLGAGEGRLGMGEGEPVTLREQRTETRITDKKDKSLASRVRRPIVNLLWC